MQQYGKAADIRWPNAIWAWEFLRRNKHYQKDYFKHHQDGPKIYELPSGSQLIVGERRYRAARKWGLLFFADPLKAAHEAGVFWKPSVFPATIPVSLRNPEREKQRERLEKWENSDLVIISDLCCRRYIFESINQSRHVVLAPRRYWIQLYCDSAHPLDDQALISIRIDGARHANKRMSSFQQLLRLHKSSGRDIRAIGYRRNIAPLSNAITALDIKNTGGSYGDISKAITDIDIIDTQKAAAKQKAVRALQRGELYRDGKYLELLS